jgi:thiosulfate reductase cytochrome b subunit
VTAAQALKLNLIRIEGHLPGDFDAATERVLSSKASALLVLPDDPPSLHLRSQIAAFADEVLADAKAALTGRLTHEDLSVYNAVQKLLYLGVILASIVVVLSGLAIWKPVQLQELTAVFGGYDTARYVHFFAMVAIVGFVVVHVVMALLVPKSLRAMITGR